MWVRNSGPVPVETENDFPLSWLKYLWVQGLGWEDVSLERINLLFRHWNGIQFPILPLSYSAPVLSCCWTDNSTYSSPHLVRVCTLPCSVLLILAVSQMHSYNASDNSDSDNSVEQGWQTLWGAETSQVSGGEGVTLATIPMTLHQ